MGVVGVAIGRDAGCSVDEPSAGVVTGFARRCYSRDDIRVSLAP